MAALIDALCLIGRFCGLLFSFLNINLNHNLLLSCVGGLSFFVKEYTLYTFGNRQSLLYT